ncbi:hypothetical protein PVAND_012916 [Polypedilum vanderplanki]|uniref:Uncharacterized protein n=1 Tax=Polypedilum vanderplanki TaxID=319348 RepID=A0A9J6CNV0_POLVA|nr:hypothetical protein PVAND_012916 [Polypedilum vanderplanki]
MDSPGAIGRRRGTTKVSAEDQALDQIAKETNFVRLKFSIKEPSLRDCLDDNYKEGLVIKGTITKNVSEKKFNNP